MVLSSFICDSNPKKELILKLNKRKLSDHETGKVNSVMMIP